MARGRKPKSPHSRELAAGTLKAAPAATGPAVSSTEPPDWMTDPVARAEWHRVRAELVKRKRWAGLFDSELARYAANWGLYVQAMTEIAKAEGPVTKSSKRVPMLSQWWVVANRAHEAMRALAGDLGINPVAFARLDGLQLDLFDEPAAKPAESGSGFAQFRKRA